MAIMESLGYASLVLELTASGCASQCGTGWGGACTSQSPGGKEMALDIGSFGEVLLFTKMCSSVWEEKKQHKLLHIRPATMGSCYNSCDWRNVGKGCFPEWRKKGVVRRGSSGRYCGPRKRQPDRKGGGRHARTSGSSRLSIFRLCHILNQQQPDDKEACCPPSVQGKVKTWYGCEGCKGEVPASHWRIFTGWLLD